ncbi:NAD P-binding protein [Gloeophyllum trabeum ATCC 11539]|uniref:NAD P-binding protein n=1 Tax=Gloeophyllum trabeum (strain ATCC 11539 / FP-39264 / Madison 617) TaxID=670483 RepID=S7Q8X3_GLOTA|nr:NAD P-binding protein [Gloeophyllum trabeum ATCC 11539]EPQ55972.1 NAD P-binding protein [Gloeophyllum trabeum ATCC 11539]
MALPTTFREYRLPKYDGYHNLTIVEASLPQLKANEVLVKVAAVSLQYRDLLVASGRYPALCKDNVVPASDMAGEIVAVGADVHGFKNGDRVCANFALEHVYGDVNERIRNTGLGAPIDGVLTEYRAFPAYSLVHIPAHLSYVEASTLPCAALAAYNALNGPTPLKAGDTVLVHGTGGVSIFALQFAKASGATVVATSSSDAKLALAKELGADHLINYKQTPDWDKEVLRVTEGRGVDHVIEVGGPGTLMRSLASVRYAGWVHVIGSVAGAGDTSHAPIAALKKAAIIRGILIGSRDQFEAMNRLIVANKVRPVVDKVFSFEEAKEAYAYLESQKHVGKIVIQVAKE